MSENKKNKGITLIALVVTIVVLLILTGITINLVFNDNGVIGKAREAAEETEKSAMKDQEEIAKVADNIDEIFNNSQEKKYSVVPADVRNLSFALKNNETGEYVNFGERMVIYYGEDLVLDENVEDVVEENYDGILTFSLWYIEETMTYSGNAKVIIYKDGIPYEWEGNVSARPV